MILHAYITFTCQFSLELSIHQAWSSSEDLNRACPPSVTVAWCKGGACSNISDSWPGDIESYPGCFKCSLAAQIPVRSNNFLSDDNCLAMMKRRSHDLFTVPKTQDSTKNWLTYPKYQKVGQEQTMSKKIQERMQECNRWNIHELM